MHQETYVTISFAVCTEGPESFYFCEGPSPDIPLVEATFYSSTTRQVCKTNPQYQYVEMARVNTADLPSRLLRPGTTEGYFCELRVQVSTTVDQTTTIEIFFSPKFFTETFCSSPCLACGRGGGAAAPSLLALLLRRGPKMVPPGA